MKYFEILGYCTTFRPEFGIRIIETNLFSYLYCLSGNLYQYRVNNSTPLRSDSEGWHYPRIVLCFFEIINIQRLIMRQADLRQVRKAAFLY
jgi:hypothetical protein